MFLRSPRSSQGFGREDLREELASFMNDSLLPRLEDCMQQLVSDVSDKVVAACPRPAEIPRTSSEPERMKKQVTIGKRCLKKSSVEPVAESESPTSPKAAATYSSEQDHRQEGSTNVGTSLRRSWRFSGAELTPNEAPAATSLSGEAPDYSSYASSVGQNSSYTPLAAPLYVSRVDSTDQAKWGSQSNSDCESEAKSSGSDAVSLIEVAHRNGSVTPWQKRVTLSRLSGELFDVPEKRSSVVVTTLMNVVMDNRFTYGVGGAIILNAMTMGVQADYMAHHWDEPVPVAFLWTDIAFCSVFVLELAMRASVYTKHFLTMIGWQWNVFDILMVGIQIFDLLGALFSDNWAGAATNAGVLRMMRIFRLFRVLRLVRVLSVFAELRMFIVSVADAMRSLFWTIAIICLCMYIGGIYLTQLFTDLQVQHPHGGRDMDLLRENYGSLSKSMLTLYMTISEGIPWSEAMEPWNKYCGAWIAFAFAAWMAFTLFALMNVITGVFVESAIRTANDDKKKLLIYQMGQWFLEADVDQSQTINWREFARHLENPKMERFLKTIDIDIAEAGDLFQVLDVHEEGEIQIDDFVSGCIRLLGSAKSIDLLTVLKLQKSSSKELEELTKMIDHRFDDLEQRINREGKSSQTS